MKNIFNVEEEILNFFDEYEKRKKRLKFIEKFSSKLEYSGKSFEKDLVEKKNKLVKVVIHGKSRKR